MSECLDRLMQRVPLPEVKVLRSCCCDPAEVRRQPIGGALGNLSGVLRDRIRLQQKVKACRPKPRRQAGVLASLPPVVGILVFLTSPDYISLLWTTPNGRMLLLLSAFWMFCGVMVMRKMINFKF
ncbi:MAG: hypothetical protein H6875_00145 [Hyphomicrobiaceae bacterium]|nr:hypothetical protein [Hyphomicrobiaceae bacterium]